MSKPLAHDISSWDFREILYSCRKCGADFRILADQEQYCHKCGEKQDWNVARRLTDVGSIAWKELYNQCDFDGQRRFIQRINERNNF